MVSVQEVRASNSKIRTALPRGLVAVFVGSTSGIGETTLREFTRYAAAPKIYFVGRSKEAGARILNECKKLNPDASFTFMSFDVSLIRNVDAICNHLREKEKHINLLWLSQGALVQGIKNEEGLNQSFSTMLFSRFRFMVNLLPMLRAAPGIRRVVSCLAGGKEGPLLLDDFQGWNVPANNVHSARGHVASAMTLGMDSLAKQAPEISFIHDFPGLVKSNIGRGSGAAMFSLRLILNVMYPFAAINTKESGERHLYLLTSARFPAASSKEGDDGVPTDCETSDGTDGKKASGSYAVDENLEHSGPSTVELLQRLRKEGGTEYVWQETNAEFERITGVKAI